MQFDTTRFGTIVVDDSKVVTFPDGLPGFEHIRRMALVPQPGPAQSPICWLQCIDENWDGSGALAFPIVSPWLIDEEYAPTLPTSALRELGITDIRKQAQFWAIVTIPRSDPGNATVNLLAPVLMNTETLTARQVILRNERYSLHTPLAKPAPPQKQQRSHRLDDEPARNAVGVAA